MRKLNREEYRMKIRELGQSKAVKKVIEALNETELDKLEALINRAINTKASYMQIDSNALLNELRQENNELKDIIRTENYYRGYYWAINGEIEWNSLSPQHIDGINDGLKYLREKPDQIIQHYGDPNPKTKVVQHLKDR